MPSGEAAAIEQLRADNRALAAQLSTLRTDYRSIAARGRLQGSGAVDPTRFDVEQRLAAGGGRAGRLTTPHGTVFTPAFVPASGGVQADALGWLGAQAVVADAFVLDASAGADVVSAAGGLGAFTGWSETTVSNPGAALAAQTDGAHVDDDGIDFRSPVDGAAGRITPESAVHTAHLLGVDVAFVLTPPLIPAPSSAVARQAVDRSLVWARRGLAEHNWVTAQRRDGLSLWAVVTGGASEDHRRRAARELQALHDEDVLAGGLGFGGYRIAGIDHAAAELALLGAAIDELDDTRPRYLPGVAEAADVFAAFEAGIDLFDGGEPARAAARGVLLTSAGRIDVTQPAFRADVRPVDPDAAPANRGPARAYLHHLFVAGDPLAVTLATAQNERFLVTLVSGIREAVVEGRYSEYKAEVLGRTSAGTPDRVSPRT
ncbi:tRNA-guanine transglycosylase [Tsukamurella soli]|uniref:tRNA-guanine transglycosylase n=1 Tax=Tsukamurella soli TaxID=644556 RepID=UPI003615700D